MDNSIKDKLLQIQSMVSEALSSCEGEESEEMESGEEMEVEETPKETSGLPKEERKAMYAEMLSKKMK